jgi:hypothetical protein
MAQNGLHKLLVIIALAVSFLLAPATQAQQRGGPPAEPEPLPMGFFITSAGLGNGADLGGLDGADAHCQNLAEAVGAGDREWRAYLSTQETEDEAAVNAIDRIGEGPWANAKGVVIASSIESLLYDNSNINYEHAITEKGQPVNSRVFGDSPNKHDILTGTKIDGTAYPAGDDMTCSNWTSDDEGRAVLGHSDRHRRIYPGSPWNSAHPSRGCGQEALAKSGGDGLFYCFAAD